MANFYIINLSEVTNECTATNNDSGVIHEKDLIYSLWFYVNSITYDNDC